MSRIAETRYNFGLDRQFHRRTLKRNSSDRPRNAIEFKHDTARFHLGCPIFDRTLALTLTDFGRLFGYRHIGEDTDPQTSLTLDVTRDRTASRFDLTRGNPLRLKRLQPV